MLVRVIAVVLLLAVSGAMQSAALAVSASDPAALVHEHSKVLQHACCPEPSRTQTIPSPMQAPRPDEHRCCFLRGPQSSLPTSTACQEQLVLTGHVPAGLADSLTDGLSASLMTNRLSGPTPPLSIQTSVVLRN